MKASYHIRGSLMFRSWHVAGEGEKRERSRWEKGKGGVVAFPCKPAPALIHSSWEIAMLSNEFLRWCWFRSHWCGSLPQFSGGCNVTPTTEWSGTSSTKNSTITQSFYWTRLSSPTAPARSKSPAPIGSPYAIQTSRNQTSNSLCVSSPAHSSSPARASAISRKARKGNTYIPELFRWQTRFKNIFLCIYNSLNFWTCFILMAAMADSNQITFSSSGDNWLLRKARKQ